MKVLPLLQIHSLSRFFSHLWPRIRQGVLILLVSLLCFTGLAADASAGINDDRYDGNIFVLYAGNGSLVPASVTLKQTLKQGRPTVLVFYIDDSSDCKQFATVVSRVQEFYGRAASIIPVDVDSIPVKDSYDPTEPGYYYEGVVPQTVIFDQEGKVRYNGKGQVPYEALDDVLREVFDLLPRSKSKQLKRRSYNEFNSELEE
ncbi:thylakoid membrane photosystem I accumulation factor [Spirulina sp. CS-785/01]|uniref:thylakoid membrane photosystem I accumulation factor n=1 Tax=Spirulina sp. CS-785/01 TaxID=3021716 RepID=UPI0023313609|nr:thylakoid membrane photosystem I accumulation factor [Spirulina sp. CS-785/01]MDB9313005.1 thylakoid membrane photosystem I accumulation factor [Spirulina sp. CS-785/01]